MSIDDSKNFLSQFTNKVQPISSTSSLENVNCDINTIIANDIFNFNDIYISNSNIHKKNINLDINSILLCVFDSPKIQNIIPIKLNDIHIKIIKYIIETKPNYFLLFEKLFSILILNEEQWNPLAVPYIIILFKKIFNITYDYRIRHFFYGISTKKLCKTIIDFLLNIIILNDTYLHKHQVVFKTNIKKLIDVCMSLIEQTKPKTIFEKIWRI